MAEQSEMVNKLSNYTGTHSHHITFWFLLKVEVFLSHVQKSSECPHDHKVPVPGAGWLRWQGLLSATVPAAGHSLFCLSTALAPLGALRTFKSF